jgi:predicted O-methyltransferase YrrM
MSWVYTVDGSATALNLSQQLRVMVGVLLDGWKDLYLPVLELIKPKLHPGAIILADNIFTFRKALRPYVEYM